MAFSPDGKQFATADEDGDTVTIFEVASDGELAKIGAFPTGTTPLSVAFNSDGNLLAVTDLIGNVTLFEVAFSGLLTKIGTFKAGLSPRSVVFSPGGNFLATSNADGDNVSMFCVNNNRNPFVEALFAKYQPICGIQ